MKNLSVKGIFFISFKHNAKPLKNKKMSAARRIIMAQHAGRGGAAGRGPCSRAWTRRQDTDQAAGREPGGRIRTRRQDTDQAAGYGPCSRAWTRRQDTDQAAGHGPCSRT
ncbi:hypothetical protein BRYFOR_08363 [Marvinbryantia formatexigens DSM 14469]|uniref:Uncharacterized protein n=1 Tax=Marvinbryantia formatexigens DSM 14469 TaxID=478749 RepID=C6LI93_9FIRM|nr:hypothetical protein BRYFOR_08363 [Marvinbryantia formatexigens DSM 14469]